MSIWARNASRRHRCRGYAIARAPATARPSSRKTSPAAAPPRTSTMQALVLLAGRHRLGDPDSGRDGDRRLDAGRYQADQFADGSAGDRPHRRRDDRCCRSGLGAGTCRNPCRTQDRTTLRSRYRRVTAAAAAEPRNAGPDGAHCLRQSRYCGAGTVGRCQRRTGRARRSAQDARRPRRVVRREGSGAPYRHAALRGSSVEAEHPACRLARVARRASCCATGSSRLFPAPAAAGSRPRRLRCIGARRCLARQSVGDRTAGATDRIACRRDRDASREARQVSPQPDASAGTSPSSRPFARQISPSTALSDSTNAAVDVALPAANRRMPRPSRRSPYSRSSSKRRRPCSSGRSRP